MSDRNRRNQVNCCKLNIQQSNKVFTNTKVNQKETNRNERKGRIQKKRRGKKATAAAAAMEANKSENTEQITIIYRPMEVQ